MERMCPLVDPQAVLRHWEAPHSLPGPWNVPSAHHLPTRSCFKDESWESKCCWDHLNWISVWTQVRLLKFWRASAEIYWSCNSPRQAWCVPCLWKSLPTNLEWPASFLGLSLPLCVGPISYFTSKATHFVNEQHPFAKSLLLSCCSELGSGMMLSAYIDNWSCHYAYYMAVVKNIVYFIIRWPFCQEP